MMFISYATSLAILILTSTSIATEPIKVEIHADAGEYDGKNEFKNGKPLFTRLEFETEKYQREELVKFLESYCPVYEQEIKGKLSKDGRKKKPRQVYTECKVKDDATIYVLLTPGASAKASLKIPKEAFGKVRQRILAQYKERGGVRITWTVPQEHTQR
ncbi:hypothetical protein K461DRAFT_292355 [Myriangium duriaei CBS 260.36]|uniref:Uncharacterized protein n=1 Tax=Myriangium duriaei CBS 260.36 TaxID=1168546 RepID=A0A9P4J788_9PEZI|nr:hypothetical protein K461DRAFT_292355 [Myriangium duriaei CBS 260.36]